MFNNFSKAGTGLLLLTVALIVAIGQALNVPITEADATEIAQNVFAIVGIILTYVGQADRQDLRKGLVRKEPRE